MWSFSSHGLLFALAVCLTTSYSTAQVIHYTNHESFDNGKFEVHWFVNLTSSTIHVKVIAATTGWVGFGFARQDTNPMEDYDVAVGGVFPNGSAYLKDYWTLDTVTPLQDRKQNFVLASAKENGKATTLEFSRLLDTDDDEEDLELQRGVGYHLVYAYHTSDEFTYHWNNRGVSKRRFILVLDAAQVIPYTNHESFDKGNFDVHWFVNFTSKRIHVKVKAAAIGWVGFGFARQLTKPMENYDVAVGGVYPNGSPYLKDYWTAGTFTPTEDPMQDFILASAKEQNGKTTTLEFSRKLDTDDGKDHELQRGVGYYLVYAYHTSDIFNYHFNNRGVSRKKFILVPNAVDGGFTDWIPGICSKTCGGGVQNQKRTCTNPRPTAGGKHCAGKTTRQVPCNIQKCPVYFSQWSDWDPCSKSCGSGTQQRTRKCINPPCPTRETVLEIRICKGCACPGKLQYTNNITFDNGQYNASWLYNTKTDTLHFKIMTYAVGWVGFGIAENRTMTNYDLAAGGVFANKSCYLKDYFAAGTSKPLEDSKQDYVLSSAEEQSRKRTVLEFSRKRITGDSNDIDIQRGAGYYLVFAFHPKTDDFINQGVTRGSSSTRHVLAPLPPQPPTDAPKNLQELYVTTTSLICSFKKVTDGGSNGVITGYRVYYRAETGTDDSTKTMNISKNSTLFVLSGLKENIMYRVWMTALNSAGKSPQSQPMFSTTAKSGTAVPQNMKIVRYNATAATVSWDRVSGAIRYRVCVQQHQVSSSQSCKDVNALPGVVRFQVLLTGLVPGQNYTSTVQPVVSGGSIDFGVQPQNATSVLIVWNPVRGATKYQICYQESGVNKEMCKDVPAGANNERFEFRLDGLKPKTKYQVSGRVFLSVDGGFTDWQDVGPCSKSCGGGSQNQSRNCTNPAPANGGLPCSGAKERTVSCNTQTCPPPRRPTDAPKNIRELYVTATSVTLGFDQVTDGGSNGVITGYRVYYRAETGKDDSTKTMDISNSSTQFVLSGLKENIMYRVWMTALNSAGESPQSQPTLSTTTKSGTDGHPVLLQRYNMSSRPRGFCVIINNKTFPTQNRRRNGAEKDEKILKTLFTKLHFIVDLKSDLTRNEILAMMEHYGSKTDHCRYNAFICIIMSHGRENDCIEGVDEKTVRVEDIMAEFDAQHCPSLEAKPKLFFIQSCRGGSWDNQCYFVNNFSALNCSIQNDGSAIQVDSTLPRSVCPKGADFLLAFATTPGYVALRTPSEGSFYIRILADVIGKLHKDVHLLDMLTVVNRKVSEEVFALTGGKQKQIPAPAFTLRKQVYL